MRAIPHDLRTAMSQHWDDRQSLIVLVALISPVGGR
jgi:hypothetical protein